MMAISRVPLGDGARRTENRRLLHSDESFLPRLSVAQDGSRRLLMPSASYYRWKIASRVGVLTKTTAKVLSISVTEPCRTSEKYEPPSRMLESPRIEHAPPRNGPEHNPKPPNDTLGSHYNQCMISACIVRDGQRLFSDCRGAHQPDKARPPPFHDCHSACLEFSEISPDQLERSCFRMETAGPALSGTT